MTRRSRRTEEHDGEVGNPACAAEDAKFREHPHPRRRTKFREYAANASGEFFTPSASFDEGEICTTSRTWAPSKAPLEQPQAKG